MQHWQPRLGSAVLDVIDLYGSGAAAEFFYVDFRMEAATAVEVAGFSAKGLVHCMRKHQT